MQEDNSNDQAAAACGMAAQQPPAAAPGASPGNTAPGNSEGGGTARILRSGIDSLYLTYKGQITEESSIRLETLKKLAQSQHPGEISLAQWQAGGHLFQVSDRASGLFAYVLRDNWFRLSVASRKAHALPLSTASISSEVLTLHGPRKAEAGLRAVIDSLGIIDSGPTVSRADICVDFVTDFPLHQIQDKDWITRARLIDRYTVNREFTGFSIGLGGDLTARLYNKTLEIGTSGKTYFYDEWQRYGWTPKQTVWRLEFQFRRSILRELGVDTFADLLTKIGGLWTYATHSWLRLADPTSMLKKRADLPTHPLWQVLQKPEWLDAPPCQRVIAPGQAPSDQRLYVNGLSAITAHMAREAIFDPDEAYQDFWEKARIYHNARAEITGLLFADYLKEKARLKARIYSTANNRDALDGADPVTKAVADAYRKKRDGG